MKILKASKSRTYYVLLGSGQVKTLIALWTTLIILCGFLYIAIPNDNFPFSPLTKYELSTDTFTAKHQCKTFFNKFHGKYQTVKHYGESKRISTLHFSESPDCVTACVTTNFYLECTFETNDDQDGFMEFRSRIFHD